MTFFADEGLDFPLVYLLRVRGYEVIYAAEEMRATTDEEILKKAIEADAILITKDKDFGEIIIRNKHHSLGAILVRIEKLNLLENCLWVADLIDKYSYKLKNSFKINQKNKIRIRNFLK